MKSNRSLLTSLAALAMGLVATSTFASKYSATITGNTHTIAYWQFDEPSGTTYASATVPTGQTVPPTANASDAFFYWNGAPAPKVDVAGIVGQATSLSTGVPILQGNSSGSTAAIWNFKPGVSDAGQGGDGSFTVEWWGKPTGASYTPIIQSTSPLASFYASFSSGVPSAGLSYPEVPMTGADTPTPNQWNFFVFTFKQDLLDPTRGIMSYYLNGKLEGYGTVQDAGETISGRSYWGNLTFNTRASSSDLDELAVFDVALSQNQILDQLYAVPEPGLLALLALGGAFLVWRRKGVAKRA